MATVYLARDVRHNRRVALKVLDPQLGAVLGVERFLSEIQVTANLQHPNLLPLFDSGEANGLLYYVMPYVEGESLRAKLDREKQLPIDEAVQLATAVASALDYAHRHGVIHRDLKPENILLHEGQPLVADFGIALAVTNAGGNRITQTGLSLGTPQYMSPEQATGDRTIDGRTDIYSLGAVTYEMLTGEAPYTGSTAQAVIAKVITDKPRSITLARETVPAHVVGAVDRALAKLPADRFHSAQEFSDALTGKRIAIAPPKPRSQPKIRRTHAVALIASGFLAGALIAAGVFAGTNRRGEESRETLRFTLPPESGEAMGQAIGSPFAITRDGRTLAYVAALPARGTKLFIRSIDDLTPRELAGTEGADMPSFSPDGKWLAFVAFSQLKKVLVDGAGAPVILTGVGSTRGIAWARNGQIILGTNAGGLVTIPEAGGAPKALTKVNYEEGVTDHRWPVLTDDGRTILFISFKSNSAQNEILAIPADSGPTTRVTQGAFVLGVVENRLVYMNGAGTLLSAPFDSRTASVSGSATTHINDILMNPASSSGFAAVSQNGNLIYRIGAQRSHVVLADAHGKETVVLENEGVYAFPRFSPSGRQIAVGISSGIGSDIWVYDRDARTMSRLSTSGFGERPEWTRDGKRLFYRSSSTVVWQPSDRSGAEQVVARQASVNFQEGVPSPKGDVLLLRANGRGYVQDIVYRKLNSPDTSIISMGNTPFAEYCARMSPDQRWVAYSSDESGMQQVYVMPFPGPGPHYQVSTDGGVEPVWAPDGRKLYYARNRTIMAVTLRPGPGFGIASRDSLFSGQYFFPINHANYDVSPDGREFLLLKRSQVETSPTFIYNWARDLRGLAR